MEKDAFQRKTVLIVCALLLAVFILVILLTIRNNREMKGILEESVRSELLAISIAARDLIDPRLFDRLNSKEDVARNQAAFDRMLHDLRDLKAEVGATYIYALKRIDQNYYFAIDTDEVAPEVFDKPYLQMGEVHRQAFLGKNSAGIMNLTDKWGSFNSGAVPIRLNGRIIGIVSTDIADHYIQRSLDVAYWNAIALALTLLVALGALLGAILLLLKRVRSMQSRLYRMANYDAITGLPNRHYVFSALEAFHADERHKGACYALFFIDLDNFKQVNDSSGHDVGDELLRHIANFLGQSSLGRAGEKGAAQGLVQLCARIGGDEFLLIVPDVAEAGEAAAIAGKMLDDFAAHPEFRRFIEEHRVGMSIGIALFPSTSDDYNDLICRADIAMYHAKAAGKNRCALYDPAMGENMAGLALSVRKRRRPQTGGGNASIRNGSRR